jgi:hypothetical protein
MAEAGTAERGRGEAPGGEAMRQAAAVVAERYWQLLAVINGWPPVPTAMPAWRWTIDSLRARP